MKAVKVQITRYISDDPQPGIVECKLIDAWSREWTFVEKTVIVTHQYLDKNSVYPQSGTIRCEIIESWQDSDDRKIVTVNTAIPDYVTDETGETHFQVLPTQITDGEKRICSWKKRN